MANLSVLLMLACAAALASSAAGLRVELKRVHSDPGATASELMRRDMSWSGRKLTSLDDTLTAPTRKDLPSGGSYVMTLSIGEPPVAFLATIDTGSSTIMTQCGSSPQYDPSSSPSFTELPCNSSLRPELCADKGCPCTFNQTYAVGWASGPVGVENFTFGSAVAGQGQAVTIAGIAFGCINESSGGWGVSSGLVGLGRRNQSLVSQLGAGRFSYCLTPFDDANSTSTLFLGPSAKLNGTGVRSTPFVTDNPWARKQYYYLNLTGISVGNTALDIPANAFALTSDGYGGIIIDSGWTTTSLVDVAYQKVRAEIINLVTLPTVDASKETQLDLCFKLPSDASTPAMPDMTFHFDGADMVLPPENYMFLGSGVWCLCLESATARSGSVLGNYQQQNMHILYDVANEMLSFAPADCSTL
ncbi:hypothetical protein EJB05_27507, partial [Eragrostis curvula]